MLMNLVRHKLAAVAALTLSVCWLQVSPASAATITPFNRAAFQAALIGGTVFGQNFDGFVDGATIGTVGDVTYSASNGLPLITSTFLVTTAPNGLGSTSVGFFQSSETATFQFANPITAFGIDVNTFADTEGAYQAALDNGGSVTSFFDTFPGFFTGQFLGFISDTPFSTVSVSALTGFTYTLDTLIYGDARAVSDPRVVPLPAAGWLLLSGMGLLGFLQRRRRS